MKSLKFFIMQSKVRILYRDYIKLIFKIKDISLRQEYLSELNREFQSSKGISDEEKIDYLIASGRQRFPLFKQMFSQII